MAPIRYSLHYEDYSEHLMSRFGKLLQMQSLVDMTLMCSSHTLRVHKAVLAASSAYFQEVLQKQSGEPLIILKMRFSVLKCLVEFMYCGKTQCLEENLDELVSAAQFLKIKGLAKVTKEGLGINNHTELPVFTPPVVINRPPQSLIDLHSQDNAESKSSVPTNPNPPVDNLNRTNKDMVVRIPFDIEGGDARNTRPRRGRPSFKRGTSWEAGGGGLARAAERALLRREHDSRKAIHQLKHLQTRHMQDYMDRVTLSQAVNSICNDESPSHNYINMDNDLMYMDQTVSSNSLDPAVSFSSGLGSETVTSSYSTAITSTANETSNTGINTAMSQYVNALKNAGLPTDLPILFESGDGSYINVNEQVLLDMVQSSEIQYEVIEQPNIIEKVADPSEIKSIDDLSKSIERGEILMGAKCYTSNSAFDKDNSAHEDTINSLNAILPDNLESFGDQPNYVVLDNHNSMGNETSHDFSCIESDMQFFTKSMSDDVKKYYEEQQLNDAKVMEQFCPTSTSLDTSFNMSLLDTKSSLYSDNINQQYNLNTGDLKRTDDCYDFSLQLPHTNVFKDDALDCLISTPKHDPNESSFLDDNLDKRIQERDEIIKDLMNIENKIAMEKSGVNILENNESANNNNIDCPMTTNSVMMKEKEDDLSKPNSEFSVETPGLQWDLNDTETNTNEPIKDTVDASKSISEITESVIDLTEPTKLESDDNWASSNENITTNKENENQIVANNCSTLNEDIPFAVGLLPLKQVPQPADENLLKRKNLNNDDFLSDVDAKCLKRKNKHKK